MTLTRSRLLDIAKPTAKLVDIEGFGQVWLRTCPQLQNSRRFVSYTDPGTGQLLPDEQAKSGIHRLIDQVMESEGVPMFTDADFDELSALDVDKLSPLFDALDELGDQKKVSGESTDT